MSKRLDENLGTVDYDGLIVTNEPVADVFTVTIRKEASAKATLKRGTVLALSSGTAGAGKMVALGTTAASNETLTANAILCDDTEIGTDADVEATPDRTGPSSLPARAASPSCARATPWSGTPRPSWLLAAP